MNHIEHLSPYYRDKMIRADREARLWWTVFVPIIVITFASLYIVSKFAQLVQCLR